MNKYVGGALFLIGAAVGAVGGFFIGKAKEEERADFEIEQMKIYYDRKIEAIEKKSSEEKSEKAREEYESKNEKAEMNREKPDISDFKPRTSPKDDVKYSRYYSPEVKDPDAPYIISPEDAQETGYKAIALLYFTDGFVSEEDGEVLDSLFDTCGVEFKSEFAKNEELNSVWVRNDRLQCDYEICKQVMTYEEYMKKHPKPVRSK